MNRILLASTSLFLSVRCGLFGEKELSVLKQDRYFRSCHLFYDIAYINSEKIYDIRPIIFVEKPHHRLGDLEF